MVDTAGPWTKAQGALEFGSIRGPSELGLKPWAHGPRRKSPGTAGPPRGHLNPGPEHPGHLSDPVGPGTRARVARACCSTPRAIGHECESPGRVVRHCGHVDPGPRQPGQLVDTANTGAQAQVTRDIWSRPGTWDPGP
eukprot:TsM_000089700 transcript=TsM_000089700 gene=TsM_000089700